MSQTEAAPAADLIFLQCVELPEFCLLQEALYWVAFRRVPVYWVGFGHGFLEDEECERAGLPPDPRGNYDWALSVMLLDDLAAIKARAENQDVEASEQDESANKEALVEAAKLHKELSEWKPKFERAIELAQAEI